MYLECVILEQLRSKEGFLDVLASQFFRWWLLGSTNEYSMDDGTWFIFYKRWSYDVMVDLSIII